MLILSKYGTIQVSPFDKLRVTRFSNELKNREKYERHSLFP
jgi:hypothetical protein